MRVGNLEKVGAWRDGIAGRKPRENLRNVFLDFSLDLFFRFTGRTVDSTQAQGRMGDVGDASPYQPSYIFKNID